MTREEEIKQAVENNLDVSVYTPQDGEMLKQTFYIGAKWADANPKSPWISVDDDLPCNNYDVIHFGFTNRVLVIDEHKNIFIAYMKKNGNNEWIWYSDEGNFGLLHVVTHWMPIPKLEEE